MPPAASSCPHRSPVQPAAPSPAPGQAVVWVGDGHRLDDTPPPSLSDIGGGPFLDHLLGEIARHGIADLLLLCGAHAQAVWARYDGTRINGAQVRCLCTPQALGAGDALAFACRQGALAERFFVLNGDSLFDVNLHDLASLHRSAGALATVALRRGAATGRDDRMELTGDRLAAWAAQLGGGPGASDGGVYLLSDRALDRLPEGAGALAQDLFPRLAEEGALAGRVYDGFFLDLGGSDNLARAQSAVAALRRPTAFLDRDGTLNVDHGYVHTVEAFDWLPGAKTAIKRLNDHGYRVVVVTNQAGVARGYYDTAHVDALHAWMQRELIATGAHVDAIYYCPHHPQGNVPAYTCACSCRKPGAGSIAAALRDWPTDLDRSFLVGDRPGDVEAAAAAGVRGHLLGSGNLLDLVDAELRAQGGHVPARS